MTFPNGRIPLICFIDLGDGMDAAIAAQTLDAAKDVVCTLVVAKQLEEIEDAAAGGAHFDAIFLRLSPSGDQKECLQQLECLRSLPALANIPIVVFADAGDPNFVSQVYEYPMTCYIRRPETTDGYMAALRNAFEFWCNAAEPPSAPPAD